ncbi:DUF424 family protein [Candidatus Woesearchaeota archaeon]|nr:DUF424 family protein [Candidatus Woesearchaeota archaeon]
MVLTICYKQGPHGSVVVITDTQILGKLFEEGRKQLDLTKEFYVGERRTKEHAREIMKASRHVHLTGKQAVELGIELGLVDSKRVLVVQGIPHATVIVEL